MTELQQASQSNKHPQSVVRLDGSHLPQQVMGTYTFVGVCCFETGSSVAQLDSFWLGRITLKCSSLLNTSILTITTIHMHSKSQAMCWWFLNSGCRVHLGILSAGAHP